MPALVDYLSRASELEKKRLLQKQWAEANESATIHCACGQKRALVVAFRCLYCGLWFCARCAEKHFGQTIQEWIVEKRIARRRELEARLNQEHAKSGRMTGI